MVKSAGTLGPFLWLPPAAVETAAAGNDFGIGRAEASRGLIVLFGGIILVALVPILFIAIRTMLGYFRARREKSFIEELTLEARTKEKAGEFVSAALAYEKLNILEKAGELYEKGRDFIKAADVYESFGRMDKVSEMFEMAGDLRRAADTRARFRDFSGAARIYNQIGDKRRAAEALEHAGNRLAAARAYREARDYLKSSQLLKEAGMLREAAEMYAISLAGEEAGKTNLDRFYAYAALLDSAGNPQKASEVFRTISDVDPGYGDVRQRLESLGISVNSQSSVPAAESVEGTSKGMTYEETTGGETTLRKLIGAGGMESRHIFRLWVQILKAVARRQREDRLPEIIAPDSIFIDSRNNVTFSEGGSRDFAYTAPEVVAGSAPDAVSAVYSMGVVLYEMLTGTLDSFGIKKPGEVTENIPLWLEELTLRCIERRREDRYQGLDEIFSVLADLKQRQD